MDESDPLSSDTKKNLYLNSLEHFNSSFKQINTGFWMGDHWTISFCLFAVLHIKEIENKY
jgi:hypothetical protein